MKQFQQTFGLLVDLNRTDQVFRNFAAHTTADEARGAHGAFRGGETTPCNPLGLDSIEGWGNSVLDGRTIYSSLKNITYYIKHFLFCLEGLRDQARAAQVRCWQLRERMVAGVAWLSRKIALPRVRS